MSSAAVREFDRAAHERLGLPSCVLMENAGRSAAERILARLRRDVFSARRSPPPWRALILCGGGGNGGDGYVLARHLWNAGLSLELLSSAPLERHGSDAALFRSVCARLGIAIHEVGEAAERCLARASEYDVLVDALLGVGARGALRAPLPEWIERYNAARGPLKVALDVPTGLDADSGRAQAGAVRADLTLTFLASKPGLEAPGAAEFTGEVHVCEIGLSLAAGALAAT